MWLDRLVGSGPASTSGSSTPQPGSRSYSPSAHSPYFTSKILVHSQRSSSFSLVSTDSSPALLPLPRKLHGSNLGQTLTAPGISSSLETLDKLLAVHTNGKNDPEEVLAIITNAEVTFDAEFDGMSLQELASSTPEAAPARFRKRHVCEQPGEGKDKLEDLNMSILACDDILNTVETNLADFRNDLVKVSADVESLQLRSTALNRRLENRMSLMKRLGPLVQDLSVSPKAVSKISGGQLDQSWVKAVCEVDRRAEDHNKYFPPGSSRIKASEEFGPLLEKLTLRAVERIRDFFVFQIKSLRSPHINAQIIQHQNFLAFRGLYSFLHKHHTTLAEEISLAYINTMRWYYLNQFSRYQKALGKLKLHSLDRHDTLGHEEAPRMAMLSGSRVAGLPHDAFNLGRRIDLFRTRNQSALDSYLAEEDQSLHHLEVPFRNFNLALMDNATAEYTFLASFFYPALPLAQISKKFTYIFEPTFELGRALSKLLVGETFDTLGILMCIRLNHQFAFELQRRQIPAVDSYINTTNMLLWPRLQVVMDHHCESVRQLTDSLIARSARSGGDAAKMTTAPHVVTQRFGQLLHGFLILSTETGDDEPVVASLQRLRFEVETFLTQQSQAYSTDSRKSHRFLYNNFSLILTIMGDTGGRLAREQREYFEKLRTSHEEKL